MKTTKKTSPGERFALGALATALMTTGLTAQVDRGEDGTDPARNLAAEVMASAHALSDRDGKLRADGPDYMAQFRAGGPVFTPALGMKAERSLPIGYALTEIRRGETRVATAHAGTAPRRSGEKTVSYDRPGGIEERYEVRAAGLYQSFVFPERPAGAGDLVVRGRVTTELERAAAVDGEGARFFREGLGGVAWGEVSPLPGPVERDHVEVQRTVDDHAGPVESIERPGDAPGRTAAHLVRVVVRPAHPRGV